MVLILVICGALAIGATQPSAVRKIGHAVKCGVTFHQLKSCQDAPVAPAQEVK